MIHNAKITKLIILLIYQKSKLLFAVDKDKMYLEYRKQS